VKPENLTTTDETVVPVTAESATSVTEPLEKVTKDAPAKVAPEKFPFE